MLMSFTDEGLGLTTSLPKVVRVNPSTASSTVSNTLAKWYMVVGSGPTGYGGVVTQTSNVYAVNLATGPGASNSLVQTFSVGSWSSFIGDMPRSTETSTIGRIRSISVVSSMMEVYRGEASSIA